MYEVFISHINEDYDVALELALELEKARCSTWCYELDAIPGPTYLDNTRRALEQTHVMVVVISMRSLGSRQIERELTLAFELGKRFMPILRDLSHAELKERQPEWADFLGAATSIRLPTEGVPAIAARVCEGLRRLGVPAVKPSPERIAKIETAIRSGPDTAPSQPRDRPPEPIIDPPSSRTDPPPETDRSKHAAKANLPAKRLRSVGAAAGLLLLSAIAYGLWPWPWTHQGQSTTSSSSTTTLPPQDSLTLGVMDIHALGPVPDWMRDFTRDGLNTVLSKAPKIHVVAKQKIEFVKDKQHLSEIEAAEQLGIAKMISGTLTASAGKFVLEVNVVDIKTGFLEDSERVEGREEQLIELQNRAVEQLVESMKIVLTSDDKNRMFARTNDSLDSYKLLDDTLTGGAESKPVEPKDHQTSGFRWAPLVSVAYAGETNPDEAAIRKLLERYRAALEAKDFQQLAAVQEQMSDGQREALTKYFDNANELKIQFSNFDILVEGDDALATFTRDDVFKDVRSGRDMHLEVRISSVLAKQAGEWRIRALKKPT